MVSGAPDGRTLTLQQEALKRVREMQQRAQRSIEESNGAASQAARQNSRNEPAGGPDRQSGNPPPFSGTGAPQGQRSGPHLGQQTSPPQGQGRQGGFAPDNILSQLFGRPSGGGAPRRGQGKTPPGGIADLLKRQGGLGDSIGGLGETVQNTVSSVSKPVAELLDSFGIDGEKLIILLVMWAVFNDQKENKTLLLALGYLLI